MFTKGKFTSGNKSMPRRVSDTTPSTMKLTMTIVAKTGRLIDVSEIHIRSYQLRVTSSQFQWRAASCSCSSSCQLAGIHNAADLGSRGELPASIGEHDVAGGKTLDDLDARAIGQSFCHFHERHRSALNFLHHALALAGGHGVLGHEDRVGGGGFDQPGGGV